MHTKPGQWTLQVHHMGQVQSMSDERPRRIIRTPKQRFEGGGPMNLFDQSGAKVDEYDRSVNRYLSRLHDDMKRAGHRSPIDLTESIIEVTPTAFLMPYRSRSQKHPVLPDSKAYQEAKELAASWSKLDMHAMNIRELAPLGAMAQRLSFALILESPTRKNGLVRYAAGTSKTVEKGTMYWCLYQILRNGWTYKEVYADEYASGIDHFIADGEPMVEVVDGVEALVDEEDPDRVAAHYLRLAMMALEYAGRNRLVLHQKGMTAMISSHRHYDAEYNLKVAKAKITMRGAIELLWHYRNAAITMQDVIFELSETVIPPTSKEGKRLYRRWHQEYAKATAWLEGAGATRGPMEGTQHGVTGFGSTSKLLDWRFPNRCIPRVREFLGLDDA